MCHCVLVWCEEESTELFGIEGRLSSFDPPPGEKRYLGPPLTFHNIRILLNGGEYIGFVR